MGKPLLQVRVFSSFLFSTKSSEARRTVGSLHDFAEKAHGFPHQNPPLLLPSSHTSDHLPPAKNIGRICCTHPASPARKPQTVSAFAIFALWMCCMRVQNSWGKRGAGELLVWKGFVQEKYDSWLLGWEVGSDRITLLEWWNMVWKNEAVRMIRARRTQDWTETGG